MSKSTIEKCSVCSFPIIGSREYLQHIRKVHGNDRMFATRCPLCKSNFVFTNIKSFIHHIRRHLPRPCYDEEDLLSVPDGCVLHIDNSTNYQTQDCPLLISEEYNPFKDIESFYLQLLLKIREGHVLPGYVMKTMAISIGRLIGKFSDCLFTSLNIQIDRTLSNSLHYQIERRLFEMSRNEESFFSSCESYFQCIRPKKMLLANGGSAYYVSIIDALKQLFQNKDLVKNVEEERKIISQFNEHDVLYHYRNGEIGRKHSVLNNKRNCYLLQLYSDDLGVVNPLMGNSGTHKLTTFYFSLDDLPACHNSSLKTVFLLLLCYRKDFEDDKNRSMLFNALKQDLKLLESDGLTFDVDCEPTYFTISTLCADNLAANELGGFTCSFNSGHCCRYCLTNYRNMKNVYKELQTVIRTVKSHNLQLEHLRSVPGDKSLYGINEPSIFLTVPSFHPITSLPPDIMHDVLEGVMPKLTSCLLHTITSNRLCSAAQLCEKINRFKYGINDRRNRPPLFKERDIFYRRVHGKAIQKYCLFMNLPFILFDLIDMTPYWYLYELLREIWDVLYSDYPRKSWLSTLQQSAEEFVQLFQTIFPDQFSPKFHFLLHAARNIAKYGPLKRQMNLRYEGKHRLLKQISNRCNNFINLPFTVSRRVLLRQCYDLMDENVFKPIVISSRLSKRLVTSFKKTIQRVLIHDDGLMLSDSIDCVKWVIMENVKYKIGDIHVVHLLGGEEIPLFVEIRYIVSIDECWQFIVRCYDTLQFKNSLWCFELIPTDSYMIFEKIDFITHNASDCYRFNNKYFVRVPYRLTTFE